MKRKNILSVVLAIALLLSTVGLSAPLAQAGSDAVHNFLAPGTFTPGTIIGTQAVEAGMEVGTVAVESDGTVIITNSHFHTANNVGWRGTSARVNFNVNVNETPYLFLDVYIPEHASGGRIVSPHWNLILEVNNQDWHISPAFHAVGSWAEADAIDSQMVRVDLRQTLFRRWSPLANQTLASLASGGVINITGISLTAVVDQYHSVEFREIYIASQPRPGDTNAYGEIVRYRQAERDAHGPWQPRTTPGPVQPRPDFDINVEDNDVLSGEIDLLYQAPHGSGELSLALNGTLLNTMPIAETARLTFEHSELHDATRLPNIGLLMNDVLQTNFMGHITNDGNVTGRWETSSVPLNQQLVVENNTVTLRIASGTLTYMFILGETPFGNGFEPHNLKDFFVRNISLTLPNLAGTILQPAQLIQFPHTAQGSTAHTVVPSNYVPGAQTRIGDGWNGNMPNTSPVLDIVFDVTGQDLSAIVSSAAYTLDTTMLPNGRHTLELRENGNVMRTVEFVVFNDLVFPAARDFSMDGNNFEFVVESPGGDPMDVTIFTVAPLSVSGTTARDSGVQALNNAQLRGLTMLGVDLTTETTTAIPAHEFTVDVGNYTGDVALSYSGESIGGERVRFSVYNPNTGTWETVGTRGGSLDASVVVNAGTYAVNGELRARAEVVMVGNGADTFAWLADTQHLPLFLSLREAERGPTINATRTNYDFTDIVGLYNILMQHVAWRYRDGYIAYMTHSGDIISSGPIGHGQWEVASEAFGILDTYGVPWGVVAGNHEVGNPPGGLPPGEWFDMGDYTQFAQWFGAQRFAGQDHYGFHDDQNIHSYNLITMGGRDFLFINLGMGREANAATQTWVEGLIEQYGHRNIIVQVHQYLSHNGGGRFNISYGGSQRAVGQGIWDNIINPNPAIQVVLCGHDRGAVTHYRTRDDGSVVLEMMMNYQTVDVSRLITSTNSYFQSNHDAFFRYMTITDDGMDFTTYSPWVDRYNAFHANVDTGSVDVEWRPTNRRLTTNAFSAYAIDLVAPPIVTETGVASGTTISANAALSDGIGWFATITDAETGLITFTPVFTQAAYTTAPIAADTPNSWAYSDMVRARNAGIVGATLPEGVLYRAGAPRWYIAELLADYMVAYTGLENISQVVTDWADRNAIDLPAIPVTPLFPDVPATHPQFIEIQALALMDILRGGEFGGVFGFGPNYTLTRAEAAVGLARMMTALGYETEDFPDATAFADWHIGGGQGGIQSWARDAVSFLYYHRVMTSTASAGTPPGTPAFIFNPNFEFHTQQLLTGMVRMMLEVEWREPPMA
ncbi:MAG: S-layer homology domain-containing protein [Oscillospiraceae bacterium]|nr:S-layer homology domain-containing protein [Oscillospiraceae bacterium]